MQVPRADKMLATVAAAMRNGLGLDDWLTKPSGNVYMQRWVLAVDVCVCVCVSDGVCVCALDAFLYTSFQVHIHTQVHPCLAAIHLLKVTQNHTHVYSHTLTLTHTHTHTHAAGSC